MDHSAGLRSPAWASSSRVDAQGESTALVVLAGELDQATVPRVERVLHSAQSDAELVVLDLRELWFMDRSGAHLIVACDRRARLTGGRLVVVRGPAQVDWFFGLSGLDRRLELVDEPPVHSAEADAFRSAA